MGLAPPTKGSAPLYGAGASSVEAEADPEHGFSCASGAVSKEVERVSVRFADDVERDAQIIPGEGWAVNFYAICVAPPAALEETTLFADQEQIFRESG